MVVSKVKILTYRDLNVLTVRRRAIFLGTVPNQERDRRVSFLLLLLPKKEKLTRGSLQKLLVIQNQGKYYLVSSLTNRVTNIGYSWSVDNGASKHKTGNKDVLENYKEAKFYSQVELGDDETYEIKGTGSVSLQLKFGFTLHIEKVLYVLGLTKNLISVGILEGKGHCVIFMKKMAYLWPKGKRLN